MKKVTLYVRGEFLGNVVRIEAKECEIKIGKFAQYPSAVWVNFKRARERNTRCFVQSYAPSLVVLEGWGHPEPGSAWIEGRATESGCVVSESKYSSCDPRWASDFDAFLAAYLAESGATVVADYRGFDTYKNGVAA
jgi:hypothetical protein